MAAAAAAAVGRRRCPLPRPVASSRFLIDRLPHASLAAADAAATDDDDDDDGDVCDNREVGIDQ